MKDKYNIKTIVIAIVFLFSVTFFILGVVTPILSTKIQVWGMNFNNKDVNLIDSVALFYESRDYLLAAIILIFTFILPIAKYVELLIRMVKKKIKRNVSLDKWNMLDVFIVALLLVNFKMGDSLIVMNLQLGTAYLSISVLSRILAIELIDRWYNIQ